MTSSAPTPGTEHYLKFMPDEVTLVLEPNLPDGAQQPPQPSLLPLDPGIQNDLRQRFREVGARLLSGDDAFIDGTGKPRRLIRIVRPDQGPILLVTVNLDQWRREPFDVQILTQGLAFVEKGLLAALDAVTAINALVQSGPPQRIGAYQILAATPNWTAAAAQDGCCAGGGAGAPIPPRPPRPTPRPSPTGWHDGFPHFRHHDIRKEIDRRLRVLPGGRVRPPAGLGDTLPFGSGVRVAILDTWPTDAGGNPTALIEECSQRLQKAGRSTTRLNAFLSGKGAVNINLAGEFTDHIAGNARLANAHLHYPRQGHPEPPFEHPDHGLFVADIISDIAPGAELRIWRVINDWGLTDTATVTEAIAEAVDWAREGATTWAECKALVINLSLVLGPELYMLGKILNDPTAACVDGDAWTQATYQQLGAGSAANRTLAGDAVKHDTLKAIFHYLNLQSSVNVLPVAAAGNESSRVADHVAPPRLPAALEGVLGVSASAGSAPIAEYSNDDDIEVARDGSVRAYGGQMDVQSGRTVDGDGMCGLYTRNELPPAPFRAEPGPGGNDYGYAQWSGTSFAAPVASGLAAAIWTAAAWDEATKRVDTAKLPAIVAHKPDTAARRDLLTAMVMLGAQPQGRAVPLRQTQPSAIEVWWSRFLAALKRR